MQTDVDIKKLFGRKIKELRLKKGLTQGQLAEMIKIGERNLSKIECGNSFVTAETLAKIVCALEVETSDLFNFEHHKDLPVLKEELIYAIQDETVDINLLYRFYKSIKL